jgi:hypothetical protein
MRSENSCLSSESMPQGQAHDKTSDTHPRILLILHNFCDMHMPMEANPLCRAAASRLHLSHTHPQDIRQTTFIRSQSWCLNFVARGLQVVKRAMQQIHCHRPPTTLRIRNMQKDQDWYWNCVTISTIWSKFLYVITQNFHLVWTVTVLRVTTSNLIFLGLWLLATNRVSTR